MKLQIHTMLAFAVVTGLVTGCGATAPSERAEAPVAGTAAPPPDALEGRSFDVVLNVADAPSVKDTLRFANGKFESTACAVLGFPEWSDYVARVTGEGIAFHVLAKHPSGTTMDWNGTVRGHAVEGVANRTMNGKIDVLTFRGSLSL